MRSLPSISAGEEHWTFRLGKLGESLLARHPLPVRGAPPAERLARLGAYLPHIQPPAGVRLARPVTRPADPAVRYTDPTRTPTRRNKTEIRQRLNDWLQTVPAGTEFRAVAASEATGISPHSVASMLCRHPQVEALPQRQIRPDRAATVRFYRKLPVS